MCDSSASRALIIAYHGPLGFKDDVAIVAGGDLSFDGHADLDPRTGKLSAGTSLSYTVDNAEALKLQAQFGPGGPSGQVSVNINF